MKKIFYNATIITMNNQMEIHENAAILIENNIISEIDKSEVLLNKHNDCEKHDCKKRILMPGFVNTHGHIPMVLMRGYADDMELHTWIFDKIFPFESAEMNKPENIKLGTELALCEMIRSGITTYSSMYFFSHLTAEITTKAGLRAVLAESMIDYKTPSFNSFDESLAYSREFVSNYKSHNLIKPSVSVHSPYTCSKKSLQRAKDLADEMGVKLQIHLSETAKENEIILKDFGMTPTAYLKSIGLTDEQLIAAHCVHVNYDDIKILKDTKVGISHCPKSNLKLASGIAPITKLLEVEAKLSIGTDGACSNNNLNMIDEVRFAAFAQKNNTNNPKVLDAQTCTKLITKGGASVLGLDSEIGSIEVGKKADFICLDTKLANVQPIYNHYSTLIYSMNGNEVNDMVVDGNFVMKDKIILTLDEEKIIETVSRV